MVKPMRVVSKVILVGAISAVISGCASSPSPHLQRGAVGDVQRTFFVTDAPTGKYFRVLREANCDDWLMLRPLTPDMAKSWYGSGNETRYRGGNFLYLCKGLFEDLLKAQQDPRVVSADAVIFDIDTAHIADEKSLFFARRKVQMQGWAVQYVEPHIEEVVERLAAVPKTAIDKVQFKAAAKWLRIHPNTSAVPMLSERINGAIGSDRYDDVFADRLDLLAILGSSELDNEVFRSLVAEGFGTAKDRFPPKGTRYNVNRVPVIAVHALVCRNPGGTRELLRKILLDAAYIQYKYSAARGLLTLGDTEFLRSHVARNDLRDANSFVFGLLQVPEDSKFPCPYNGLHMEEP